MQFPWKLVDGSLDFALLASALLYHQLDVLVVEDTDEVALWIAVIQGDVVHLEDIPEERQQEENDFRQGGVFQGFYNPRTSQHTKKVVFCRISTLMNHQILS